MKNGIWSWWRWYTVNFNGEDIKFQSKDFEDILLKNDELKEHLYNEICEKVILKYQDKIGIDDVEVDDTDCE